VAGNTVKESLPDDLDVAPDGHTKEDPGMVSVREFMTAPTLGLDLELLQGGEGLENEIRSPRIECKS
jgi:hypothetical protein